MGKSPTTSPESKQHATAIERLDSLIEAREAQSNHCTSCVPEIRDTIRNLVEYAIEQRQNGKVVTWDMLVAAIQQDHPGYKLVESSLRRHLQKHEPDLARAYRAAGGGR